MKNLFHCLVVLAGLSGVAGCYTCDVCQCDYCDDGCYGRYVPAEGCESCADGSTPAPVRIATPKPNMQSYK